MKSKTIQQQLGLPLGATVAPAESAHQIDIEAWGVRVHGTLDAGTLSIPACGDCPFHMSTELRGVLWRQMVSAVWRMGAYSDRPISPVLTQILDQNGDVKPRTASFFK